MLLGKRRRKHQEEPLRSFLISLPRVCASKAVQLLVDTMVCSLVPLQWFDHQGLDRLKTAAKSFGAGSTKVQALIPASWFQVERVMWLQKNHPWPGQWNLRCKPTQNPFAAPNLKPNWQFKEFNPPVNMEHHCLTTRFGIGWLWPGWSQGGPPPHCRAATLPCGTKTIEARRA